MKRTRPKSCHVVHPPRPLPRLEAMEPRWLLSGSIQGFAWEDLNGDGVMSASEPRLPGWTIYLDANHNAHLDPAERFTTSDSSGHYAFNNLSAGNYLIGAVIKPGWSQTYPSVSVAASGATASAAPAPSGTVAAAIARAMDPSSYSATEYDSASTWVVGLSKKTSVKAVRVRTGTLAMTPSGAMSDTYVLRFSTKVKGTKIARLLRHTGGVTFYYPQVARQQKSRFIPNDPLFNQEWHLRNTGQLGGLSGADANVTPAWDHYQGAGVVVGVVDDGLQYGHPDLSQNYDFLDSYDFNDNDNDPRPDVNNDPHGTAVAGIIAARGNNGIGISGAAPQAKLAGLRLTDAEATDAQEAAALSYHWNNISIYSNSWGPDDDGRTLQGPGPDTLTALQDAVTQGRNGKGSVYVWASGNGLQYGDNVNYDGYANSRYVIATTALDDRGKQAFYAEPGAPILVATYGGGVSPGIMTTDLRGADGFNTGGSIGSYTNDYYNNFGGTSASAPLVSGIVALMLQANPNLTWRDVKQILVNTARKNDPSDSGWSLNGAGHWVNHKYGFGSVDAAAAVNAARTWTNVAPEVSATSGTMDVNQVIPDNSATGLTSSVNIDAMIKVETVEVEFDATHPRRGDLRVVLTSPDGTQSVLAEVHDDPNANYDHWTFTSNRHWDEIAWGTWKLTVTDGSGGYVGTLDSWKLNVYGTAVTSEQYVALAPNANVTDVNFGFVPLPGAKVTSATFAYQTGQKLLFTFDRPIASTFSADAFDIENDTTGQSLPDASLLVSYDPASRTASVTFTGLLPDGNYTARLKADRITLADGGMLDGNGDGLGGDDYTFDFFQLNGDANRDRVVNTADLKILFANRGAANPTWEQADFNYDHAVDFIDYQTLTISLGHALPAPSPAPVAATTTVGESEELASVFVATPAPLVATRPSRPTFATKPILRHHVALLDDTVDDFR